MRDKFENDWSTLNECRDKVHKKAIHIYKTFSG